MFDSMELPEPTRVTIPRVRNGDLVTQKSDSIGKERARLLGIFAIVIAETTNQHIHYNLNRDYSNSEEFYVVVDAWASRYWMLLKLKEVMQLLMDNDLDIFLLILDGIETQNEAEANALSLFRSFVDSEAI